MGSGRFKSLSIALIYNKSLVYLKPFCVLHTSAQTNIPGTTIDVGYNDRKLNFKSSLDVAFAITRIFPKFSNTFAL